MPEHFKRSVDTLIIEKVLTNLCNSQADAFQSFIKKFHSRWPMRPMTEFFVISNLEPIVLLWRDLVCVFEVQVGVEPGSSVEHLYLEVLVAKYTLSVMANK